MRLQQCACRRSRQRLLWTLGGSIAVTVVAASLATAPSRHRERGAAAVCFTDVVVGSRVAPSVVVLAASQHLLRQLSACESPLRRGVTATIIIQQRALVVFVTNAAAQQQQ
jgi:hypothetical protein